MKFGIRDEIYNKILDIANKYKYKFIVFGSRARGNYKNNSDIDIAIYGNVSKVDEINIKNDFDSIDMEYMVDLVFAYKLTNLELIKNIETEGVEIK